MTGKENDIVIKQKISKAKSTLNEIPDLLQFKYYNTAINRMYYSSFYAVQALLLTIDIQPKSHKGILNMFSLHFVKKEKVPEPLSDFYATIFHERGLADYTEIEDYNKEMVETLYFSAVNFIQYIEKLLEEK